MKTISVSKILPQLIATSGVMLLTTQTGLIDGWNSPNIARLSQPNSTIPLTSSESSWLASCTKLGKFASVTFVPFVIELLGTKKAIHCAFLPVAVAWILIMTAESSTGLFIARISSGITVGLTWSCYSNYLGEVVSARLRGAFTAAANVGWSLGALLASLGETYLPESISTSIYLAACLLGILMFAWIPDSPYRLAKSGDATKARESLDWYRGREATDSELKEILEFVEADARVTFAERLGQLTSPQVRRALALVTFVNVLPQLCGVYNVIYYMQTILTNGKASSSLVDPSRTVIYANVVLLASAVVGVNSVHKLGRRVLLVTSSTFMALAYFGLGLHYFLLDRVQTSGVLPVVSVIVLLAAYSIGFSPVMGILLGEMFPSGAKSSAATIVTFATSLAGFVSTKVYQSLIDAIGEHCVFWSYAGIAATMIPVAIIWLPETRGKSLREIQCVLSGM